MRKLTILAVLALAACNEHAGWNPNYTMGSSSYGDYQRGREVALTGQGSISPVIPVQLPTQAPTAADLTRAAAVPAASRTKVAAKAVPVKSGTPYSGTPSVLARYAQAERHNPGTTVYPRTAGSASTAERACRSYANSATAQTAFIAAGGPIIDPHGMDPDGDGFVCGWDPRPYRQSAL